MSEIMHLMKMTPKCPALLVIIKEIVIRQAERMIILTSYPTPEFHVESLLNTLGIEYVTLRAGMLAEERTAVAADFSDPKSTTKILVSTYATCSVGLNLHHCCAKIVMLEPATNVNTIMQVVG